MSSVMKRVLTGASLSVFVFLAIVLRSRAEPGFVVWCVCLVLSVLGAWEIGRMIAFRALKLSPALPLAALLVAVPAWLARDVLSAPNAPYLVLLAGALVASAVALALVPRARAKAVFFALWSAVPLWGLVSIDLVWGTQGLACIVILSKVGDIFGYFVGRAIGKRHPFPNLSPGKTVAGCVASVVVGTLAGLGLAFAGALPGSSAGLLAGAFVGLTLNLAAQAGDLLESKVKRAGGVKDSSRLAASAGGVLDVVDSLLCSVPVAVVLWPLVF